jgi:hypothetical protein
MLLIRCNAKYHITTGCEIETSIWMSYSDSTHFFDKLSYKILFVLNYGLRENREFTGAFRTEANLARVADRRGRGALTRTLTRGAAALAQTEANEWGPADRKTEQK